MLQMFHSVPQFPPWPGYGTRKKIIIIFAEIPDMGHMIKEKNNKSHRIHISTKTTKVKCTKTVRKRQTEAAGQHVCQVKNISTRSMHQRS